MGEKNEIKYCSERFVFCILHSFFDFFFFFFFFFFKLFDTKFTEIQQFKPLKKHDATSNSGSPAPSPRPSVANIAKSAEMFCILYYFIFFVGKQNVKYLKMYIINIMYCFRNTDSHSNNEALFSDILFLLVY